MTECTTQITGVTVYPGQARVTRQGRVELPAGPAELLLPDLPLSLLPESVRVAGRGSAHVRLMGVEVQIVRYALPPEGIQTELDREIERLEDQDRALSDQLVVMQHRLEMLSSMAQAAPERLVRGYTWGRVGMDGMAALLGFLHQSEGEIQQHMRQVEIERRELGWTLEQLRRQRDDRRQTRQPDRYTVRVPLEVLQEGALDLELTYVCGNASWTPLYDLRLADQEGAPPAVVLTQLAQVTQKTGEDWADVRLAVSTARPALAARLPELNPWYISLYRPAPPPVAKGRLAAMPAPQAMPTVAAAETEDAMAYSAREEEPAPAEAVIAQAEARKEGAAVVYDAPGKASVPADASPHKVFLGTTALPAEFDWVTAPKVEAHAYRRARLENTAPSVLLAGQASLFDGDTFVGSTPLPETGPGGQVEVYLGVDDQVKVEREQVERAVDKSGLLDKVRRIRFTYRIRLRNLHSERLPLTVLDQIPVSRTEEVKVKLLDSEPAVEPKDMGELRWELDLAAGEQREISFSFHVEMPLEGQVVGLP